MKPIVFKNINISVPYKEIYRRLGYRENITSVSPKQKKEIEDYIAEALSCISLKGTGMRLAISGKYTDKIVLENGTVFKSSGLAKMLQSSSGILLIAATCGNKIMSSIKKNSLGKNVTKAVVFDAVASEMTDSALDWIIGYFRNQLRREGKNITSRRFSCGYGDFVLQNQKIMHKILKLKSLGVKLSKTFILIPEKSVTAVAGII